MNTTEPMQLRLEEMVGAFVRARELFPQAGRVIVAVSGGADSMALLAFALRRAGDWGCTVDDQTRLSIDELMDAARTGRLEEVFGTGTAAVISPVGQLYYEGETVPVRDGKTGALTQRLYDTLTGIQYGRLADPYGWVTEV